jgi:hypothetical protein
MKLNICGVHHPAISLVGYMTRVSYCIYLYLCVLCRMSIIMIPTHRGERSHESTENAAHPQ